jgi:SAM-dependent methyltransferase
MRRGWANGDRAAEDRAGRIAAYYERQASTYDAAMDGDPRNATLREAFQALVASSVPVGSWLLDFGCGTGHDALQYAKRGLSVVAYDQSPAMIAQLMTKCAHEVAAGRIVPAAFPFADFPEALPAHPPLQAIAADFAVLNLVAGLDGLFERFAQLVGPGGLVLASVLNPFYWRDLRTAWWWRSFAAGVRTGTLRVDGGDSVTYRHLFSSITRAAQGRFALVDQRGRGTVTTQFVFLVFRRVA